MIGKRASGRLYERAALPVTAVSTIIHVLLATLERGAGVGELIDNVAGGNVRLALDLVEQFFGSGHVDTQKIVDIYGDRGSYYIPVHEFLRAVMFGDAAHYDPSRSYVANLFDLSTPQPSDHFILPLLVSQLATWSGPGIENGFVHTAALYDRMQGMGYTSEQVDYALVRAHSHRLIETAARRVPERGEEMPSAVRATTVGVYHIQRLAGLFTYVDAVVVDIPILVARMREQIHDVRFIHERLDRASVFCRYLDSQWEHLPDHAGPLRWPDKASELRADIDRIRQRLVQLHLGSNLLVNLLRCLST